MGEIDCKSIKREHCRFCWSVECRWSRYWDRLHVLLVAVVTLCVGDNKMKFRDDVLEGGPRISPSLSRLLLLLPACIELLILSSSWRH